MKRSSFLDCQSIGQSLKRVKISTSPGELRLDRDIESLITSKQWIIRGEVPSMDSWPACGNELGLPPSYLDRRVRAYGEIICSNAKITRDPVDPLRLRLACLHRPSPSSSSSPLPLERWTFLLQMPRMYPHVPPSVTRVSRDVIPFNEHLYVGSMTNDAPDVDYIGLVDAWERRRTSTAIVASSVMQTYMEPPLPENVLIKPLPPTQRFSSLVQPDRGSDENDGTTLLDFDLSTSVYNAWSPVSNLGDMIDFLMTLPERRREWWAKESNRLHHQRQQRFRNSGVPDIKRTNPPPVGHPAIAPNIACAREVWSESVEAALVPVRSQLHHSLSSHSDMDDGDDLVESMIVDARPDMPRGIYIDKHVNPFSANRFDVGYDRGATMRHWGAR